MGKNCVGALLIQLDVRVNIFIYMVEYQHIYRLIAPNIRADYRTPTQSHCASQARNLNVGLQHGELCPLTLQEANIVAVLQDQMYTQPSSKHRGVINSKSAILVAGNH